MSSPWSKWNKYKLLRRSTRLRAYLPVTKWLGKKTLKHMLQKYPSVIIKPSGSYGGTGVVRAYRSNRSIAIHYERVRKTYRSFDAAYAAIRKQVGRNAIVQKRISLAKVSGRPFDLRVMVQRRRSTKWSCTGLLAKVAGQGYIITNVERSKGKVIPFKTALRHIRISQKKRKTIPNTVQSVAITSAQQLQKTFHKQRTMGIDIGLDNRGKPWIIEANFKPATSLFLKLKDRSMYRKIMRYK